MSSLGAIAVATIAVYLVAMAAVGVYFRRFSRDADDFFRAGGAAPWWLVGASLFMQSFSAVTFTGVAAQAYAVGVSAAWILWCNALGFLLHAVWLGPLFRRTRARTQAEVIRGRFGPGIERFYIAISSLTAPFFLAINLLGAATFVSAVFGTPLVPMIVVIASVATLCSTLGGRPGGMATGYLQMIVLLSLTAVIGGSVWIDIGGLTGLASRVSEAGLDGYFRLLRPADQAPAIPGVVADGAFTWGWLAALLGHSFLASTSISTACRFHAVRDERDARLAALMAFTLLVLGTLVWGLPTLAARVLHADEVNAVVGLRSEEDAAYVIASLAVLPPALSGLLAVTMITATMSVLEGAQAFIAANLADSVWPSIRRTVGLRGTTQPGDLRPARFANALVGAAVAGIAVYAAVADSAAGMFDLLLSLMALLGVPMAAPLAMGLLRPRSTALAAWASFAAAFAASATLYTLDSLFDYRVSWQSQVAAVAGVGILGYLAAEALGRRRPTDAQAGGFFDALRTPLTSAERVAEAPTQRTQQLAIGGFGLAIAAGIACLALAAADRPEATNTLAVAGLVALGACLALPRGSRPSE